MSRTASIRSFKNLMPQIRPVLTGLVLAGLLAGCATKEPPAPPAPPVPTVVQTDIILTPPDEQALKVAMDQLFLVQPNRTVPWISPETGLAGAVKVLRDGFDDENRPCREFHSVITRGNLYKHSIGFLCKQSAGGWEVVDVQTYPLYRHGEV
ncbi:RT0821/Lpp0805 family surface protein [Indioceanicola profundi]|uniref:RT0821/Lpp0805 family surface protein n=1 Tax=Indioceanicola profundi TaxID=2220096 RepID=UPI000E6AB11C|nr:RT0821/Lpp0805 family surface protein [Indioceanicola profundi]